MPRWRSGAETTWAPLEPGKQADLLVVDGNPLDDITVLEDQGRIKLVMCGGGWQSSGAERVREANADRDQ